MCKLCVCIRVRVFVCMYVCVYVRGGYSEVASWLVAQQAHGVLYSVLLDPNPPTSPHPASVGAPVLAASVKQTRGVAGEWVSTVLGERSLGS